MSLKKLFIVIIAVIFIVIQIALVDMWGNNSGFILMGGFLSLAGGAIGALSAFFIAREQIKQQESMKITDLKLEKYEEILEACEISIDLIKDLKKDMDSYVNILSITLSPEGGAGNIFVQNKSNIVAINKEFQNQKKIFYKNAVYVSTLERKDKKRHPNPYIQVSNAQVFYSEHIIVPIEKMILREDDFSGSIAGFGEDFSFRCNENISKMTHFKDWLMEEIAIILTSAK